ncbi:hypothetical protein BDV59DRAFT_194270 [Aspergillus ambiguus]|uniref:glycosyltransferase family 4 protein n=1 Tax=Aspergillus ambiguus TaxID=176160 RepID=UPI003CCD4856
MAPSFPSVLRSKRILLTTESFGPVNGVSRTTTSLVEYLRRNGVDVVVVAPQFEAAREISVARDLRLPGYPLPYNPDLTVVYPFRLDDVYRRSFQPDIIYVASPASLGFQVLLQMRQLQRPPVVLLNFQTDLSAYSEIIFPAPLDRFAVWLLATVQGYLFRHPAVHTVFYPCAAVLAYLKTAGAPVERSVRLGRGVDTALFHPSRRDDAYRKDIAPNGEIILVCVCRLAPEKGFEFLAGAATRLAESKLAFKLLIVGGNRNPAVETRVHRLFDPVRAHVIFTGFLTGVPLARAYASADVFLHCSVTETFGLVVLEAMASGLPVIARNQGGPSDIVQHQQTGYLVPPDDLDRFVAVTREVSAHPSLRPTLAAAARRYAEETTWEKINHRVACQMAAALEQRADGGEDAQQARMVLSMGERLRMTAAVAQRHRRNLPQRLIRKERLMAAHQHIVERHQAHQHIVMDYFPRVVVVEQIPLLLVHIQRQPAHLAGLQRLDRRPSVDQSAARRVHQQGARLHPRQRFLVDDVPGALRQRTVQADDVAVGQQRLQIDKLAVLAELVAAKRVKRQQPAPKAVHDARKRQADAPHAHHAHRLPAQRQAQESLQVEVALADAVVRAVRLAVQRLDQRHRELGHRLGRVARHVGHEQAQLLRRAEVDVVEPGAAEEDGPHAVAV